VQGNFFISFFVLTNALEDPKIIGGKGIEVLNTVLKYCYVGLLLTCFILALGNRPQGSVWRYTVAFIGYAVFTLYMTVRQHDLSFNTCESADVETNAVCRFLPGDQGRGAGSCCGTSRSKI
jgi:chitin synthase